MRTDTIITVKETFSKWEHELYQKAGIKDYTDQFDITYPSSTKDEALVQFKKHALYKYLEIIQIKEVQVKSILDVINHLLKW